MKFSWHNEYAADSEDEVPSDIMRANLAACERVLEHPEQFPRADFEYVEGHWLWLASRVF